MKTYIINLEKDANRRKYMEQLLVGSPFTEPEFVKAVYGKALSAQEKAEIFDQKHFGYVFDSRASDGEIGCAVSHYRVWKNMAESDHNVAFVLEDDVKFDGDFAPLARWSAKWLDSPRPRVVLFSHYFFYYPCSVKSEDGYIFSRKPLGAFGAYCYGMNRTAATLLANCLKPNSISDDWDYFQRRGLEVRAPLVHPVSVDYGFETNIEQRSAYIVSKFDAGARLIAPCYFSRIGEFYRLILYKTGLLRFCGKY